MLEQVCAEIRNYFTQESDKHSGTYSVVSGAVTSLPPLYDGQYYRITGSNRNDGVYCHGIDDMALLDEEFTGQIWVMKVPKAFMQLCNDIQAWTAAHASALDSPYISESYSGYAYTKGSNASGGGGAYSWQDHFARRLNPYRKACL